MTYSGVKPVGLFNIYTKKSSVSRNEFVRSLQKYHFPQSYDDISAVILQMLLLHIGHLVAPLTMERCRHHGCIHCLQQGSFILHAGLAAVHRHIGQSFVMSISFCGFS
jgi:hypothetical protein